MGELARTMSTSSTIDPAAITNGDGISPQAPIRLHREAGECLISGDGSTALARA
jgi:hypothetical protein